MKASKEFVFVLIVGSLFSLVSSMCAMVEATQSGDMQRAREPISHTMLIALARIGDAQRVNEFISRNGLVGRMGSLGESSLMVACVCGHSEVVDILIQAGVDVNAQSDEGDSPLSQAACHGHDRVVRLLLSAGVSIDAQDANGYTALMLAAIGGHVEVVNVLLDHGLVHGFNIDMADNRGRTALAYAVWRGSGGAEDLSKNGADIVALLVRAGARNNLYDMEACAFLLKLAARGYTDVLRVMLDARVDVDIQSGEGHTPLMIAANKGHAEMVTMLLHAGALINQTDNNGNTALMHAVRNVVINAGGWHTVEMLVWAKARLGAVNNAGSTVMDMATPFWRQIIVMAIDEKNELEAARDVVAYGSASKVGTLWNQIPFEVRELVGQYLMSSFGRDDGYTLLRKRVRSEAVPAREVSGAQEESTSAKGLKRRRS